MSEAPPPLPSIYHEAPPSINLASTSPNTSSSAPASGPVPARDTQLTPTPFGATRTRSFSLLQNIALPNPFAPRPPPLRASTTQIDGQGEMSRSSNMAPSTELPPEITLQIETFLKQITSPAHSAPFTPDRISSLFQAFYVKTFNVLPSFLPSASNSTINLQPLLTSTEISDRKRLRNEAHLKRQIWEEEIERRVTTQIYERIFQPKSSDDAERDLKLQGKIKALVVVGVTLEHLGVELTEKEKEMLRPAIDTIGRELRALDEVKSPREKLHILLGVHKVLVDGLTFPSEDGSSGSQSSADLLLPVLIYSIIQANTESLISNIQFILRFRADSLLQGEASYCLTNMEAAIEFLETVDLASLNLAAPLPDPPTSPEMQRTSSTSSATPLKRRAPSLPVDSADPLNALPPDTADSALKSLAGALEGSYKLLWSKVQLVEPPKTLDDVRKLIQRPFSGDETPETKDSQTGINRLIVGTGVEHKAAEERGNIITSGFRTLGTSLSRPFSSTRTPPLTTVSPTPRLQQREMQDMVAESLSGTQSRQLFTSDSTQGRGKIKRVDARFLEVGADQLKIGDIPVLLSELRRLVVALDERGGFTDE